MWPDENKNTEIRDRIRTLLPDDNTAYIPMDAYVEEADGGYWIERMIFISNSDFELATPERKTRV